MSSLAGTYNHLLTDQLCSLFSPLVSVHLRIMVGVGSSISAIADIPYLQEISPPSMRGRISSSYEMLVVIGVLISFAVDVMLNDASPEAGWR